MKQKENCHDFCTMPSSTAAFVLLLGTLAGVNSQCLQTACFGNNCDGWTFYTCDELEGFGCECGGCECPNDIVPDGNYCNDGEKPNYDSYLGDGYCDADLTTLNSENCDWDYGDCCKETCEDGAYVCGDSRPYDCQDPDQSSYYSCQSTCFGNNCDYYSSYELSCWNMENQYDCDCSYCQCELESTTAAPTTTPEVSDCPLSRVGDGYCDTHTLGTKACNTDLFNYDGGDCCPSTCEGSFCGWYGYDCQDPNGNLDVCNVGTTSAADWIGDGYCDSFGAFNTEACQWDGGDCCADTCVDGEVGVSRRNLQSYDYYLYDITYNYQYLNYVYVDYYYYYTNNFEFYNYYYYGDGTFLCGIDSDFDCADPSSNSSHCPVAYASWIGDGQCDSSGSYNTMACGWDGGDCCDSTCINPNTTATGCVSASTDCDYYITEYNDTYGFTCADLENEYDFNCKGCLLCDPPCSEFGKVCLDPAASDFGDCETDGYGAGNGICEDFDGHNTAACNWDGGDCCVDTCENPTGLTECVDDSFYNCDYYVAAGYTCAYLTEIGLNCAGCALCGSPPCNYDSANKVCRDPDSNSTVDDCDVSFPEYLGDNWCDIHGKYNTAQCNWDGGDCCHLSCLDNNEHIEDVVLDEVCNTTRYKCLDPQFACIGEWTQWGNCDATCGGGQKERTFAVTQNATGGGTTCKISTGKVQQRSCNTATCDADADGIEDQLDSCPEDSENDADSDSTCGNIDDCPYDAENDADQDNLCGNHDICPYDRGNDFDNDGLCGDVDSCPLDAENDADSDTFCVPDDPCPSSDDQDSDLLCFEEDSCPLDAGNDADSDAICGDIDSCPTDANNDQDLDGVCDGLDDCVAFDSKLGDQICDATGNYNTHSCGWDGGDCCEHSCRHIGEYLNVTFEYPCSDQNYTCLDPIFAECTYESPSLIGDGHCDGHKRSNTAACNWDGGDCCPSTCESTYYACGSRDYDCLDPDADTTVCNVYFASLLGDGRCDSENGQFNTKACGWDGGDCCAQTCNDTAAFACGHWRHFDCLDPSIQSNSSCGVAYPSRLADGLCDMNGHYNTAACDWDGGDCCSDTCASHYTTVEVAQGCGDGEYQDCDYWIDRYPESYTCSILQNAYGWDCSGCLLCSDACTDISSCKDPNSTDFGVTECLGINAYLGDGLCHTGNENTEACGWDGGDCCIETCEHAYCGYYDSVYGHVCMDPNATEYKACDPEFPEYIGDSMCDSSSEYNSAACNWDGGDCCELSCLTEDSAFSYECGLETDYDCQNPEYSCKGSWTQWGNCDASCGGGSKLRTFLITQNATGGGTACRNEHEQVFIGTCNTQDCDQDGDGLNDDVDSCPSDAENDVDSDLVCGNVDECPRDTNDDSDGDGSCDSLDLCPSDAANDYDQDGICGDIDSCPEDPGNDADSDLVCDVPPPCIDGLYDEDSDEICDDDDSCPNDAGNDADGDYTCSSDDTCPMDAMNDVDSDGICDSLDACVAIISKLGDGTCDEWDTTFGNNTYNTKACNWDGGDCCAHSCLVETSVSVSDSSSNSTSTLPCEWAIDSPVFSCKDPLYADCEADDASYVGDGYCDSHKRTNTAACNWDGGDCCSSTCDLTAYYQCGNYDYDCLDPDADNDACTVASSWLGDGFCDAEFGQYNTAACDWDGGDCCSSTCQSSVTYGCGHYASYICLDPEGNNTVCDVAYPSRVGDGTCDLTGHYNSAGCDWDGGDCCPDTCVGCVLSDVLSCQNPNSTDFGFETCYGVDSWIGDGYCDSSGENTHACNWDGGDCCEDKCACSSGCFADCGSGGYFCQDPTSSTYDSCGIEYPEYIADGQCDSFEGYNTHACGWDGGDCCELSCLAENNDWNYLCGDLDYDCLDPKYSNTVSDDNSAFAAIGDGLRNVISENSAYSAIDGGSSNQVYRAAFASIVGGYRNVVMSKHGAILGGFENEVSGRLATIVGGARNTVAARHSTAFGFQAHVKGALSIAAAFHANIDGTTDNDAQCVVDAEDDNTIQLCADKILFNDDDVLPALSRVRRLADASSTAKSLEQRLESLREKMVVTRAAFVEKMESQTSILAMQEKKLSSLRQEGSRLRRALDNADDT